MSHRPKRKVQRKTEVAAKIPRNWRNNEIEILLNCIMKYGHKDLQKLQEHLPDRSIENIKSFLRTAHDRAGKTVTHGVLDAWIDLCSHCNGPPWGDSLQVAQIIKYLSVDGLIENHPLPGSCQGIDFSMAYRLIYQALMGYPIQPVSKSTAEFVLETLMELKNEMKNLTDGIKNVQSFFQKKDNIDKDIPNAINSENLSDKSEENLTIKKPLRVYERKRQSLINSAVAPSLKIIVEEQSCSGEGSSKDFSLTVEGNSSQPTVIKVPVPSQVIVNEDEEKLLKSLSYNPFQIPEKWLEEPFHLNLILKL